MTKFPFTLRPRDVAAGSFGPVAARRPFRLWMTGSLAVVMAALIPMRDVTEAERGQVMRLLRHSRYGVADTVERIEAAARDHGLAVLARMPGAGQMLVLASSVGGTPVVMDAADSAPAMPLSLMVLEGRAGGADVMVASTDQAHQLWSELPSAVVDDLDALPSLVDRALL